MAVLCIPLSWALKVLLKPKGFYMVGALPFIVYPLDCLDRGFEIFEIHIIHPGPRAHKINQTLL